MIAGAFLKSIAQLGDPRFQRVLALGIALTLGLLAGLSTSVVWFLGWIVPDSVTLPFIGNVTFVDNLASGAGLLLMLVLSVVLMVPVASAFISLLLDEIADAVEARYYPHLAPVRRTGLVEGLRDGLGHLGVLIAANVLALLAYLLLAPAAYLIFIALNGFLLGREYFQLVALRRLDPKGARIARRRNAVRLWIAGALMAVPLTIPVVNLLVPVLGVATFTHLFHRITATSGQTSPDPRP